MRPTLRLLPALALLGMAGVPVEILASRDPAALGLATASDPPPAVRAAAAPAPPRGSLERCFGVARAGADDCQSPGRRCAGRSTRDGQGDAWIWLPAGLCGRLVGGSLSPVPGGAAVRAEP